jgi:outer membrane lipoprotein-sorting protein
MKRLLHTLFFISIVLTSTLANAQQQDEKAGKILDDFVLKTQNAPGFVSTFLFTVVDLKDDSESSFQGSFSMKGEQYFVEAEQMDIYFDGETQWNYLPDVNEVNITEPESLEEQASYFDNPTRFFRIYKDDFFYTYVGEDVRKSKPVHVLDLYPKLLDKSFSRIRLVVEKGTFLLASAQIFGKDGIHYLLEILTMESRPIDDALFRFDPSSHPGVEIIDLR